MAKPLSGVFPPKALIFPNTSFSSSDLALIPSCQKTVAFFNTCWLTRVNKNLHFCVEIPANHSHQIWLLQAEKYVHKGVQYKGHSILVTNRSQREPKIFKKKVRGNIMLYPPGWWCLICVRPSPENPYPFSDPTLKIIPYFRPCGLW